MPLVSRSRVGAVAFDRLIRDGVCTPLSWAFALPRDIRETPALRALAVRDYVPAHTVLSGLGGLWVTAGGSPASVLDVVGPRGLHRAAAPTQAIRSASTPPTGPPIAFHSGRAPTEQYATVCGLKVANSARCCIDALRWGDHAVAIPAVMRAVRLGYVTVEDLRAAFAQDHPRGPGYARLKSVWRTLAPALAGTVGTPRSNAGTTDRDASIP